MKRKRLFFIGAILLTLSLFISVVLVFFNPLTPIGVIRFNVLAQGYIINAFTLEAKEATEPSELGLSEFDSSEHQSYYIITKNVPINFISGVEETYWLVTDSGHGYSCNQIQPGV